MSLNDLPKIDAAEFQKLGLLMEVNRRVLHPLGFALAVTRDEDTGEVTWGPVYDARSDPEGIYFDGFSAEEIERLKALDALRDERAPARMKSLGYVVEPVRENRIGD